MVATQLVLDSDCRGGTLWIVPCILVVGWFTVLHCVHLSVSSFSAGKVKISQ